MEISLETAGSFGNEPPAAALCIYRILQEALQNVARHAGAASVAVKLARTDDQIVLTVRDSGAGFDPSIPAARKGLGLISMQERARLVGGSVAIESAPGRGTTLRANVRINQAAEREFTAGERG
jgi:signal transduction histidine kinase